MLWQVFQGFRWIKAALSQLLEICMHRQGRAYASSQISRAFPLPAWHESLLGKKAWPAAHRYAGSRAPSRGPEVSNQALYWKFDFDFPFAVFSFFHFDLDAYSDCWQRNTTPWRTQFQLQFCRNCALVIFSLKGTFPLNHFLHGKLLSKQRLMLMHFWETLLSSLL